MTECKICGGSALKKVKPFPVNTYGDVGYKLTRCLNCRVIFTDPEPDPEELNDIYRHKYFYDSHLITANEKKYRAEKIARYIARQKNIKKILDIGCMHGFLIKNLKEKGYDVFGIEIHREAVEYSRKNNLNVANVSLGDFIKESRERYDLIILNHVLEHLPDPREKLGRLRENLTENGRILLLVPNAGSTTRKIFGKYWGYWDVPAHIFHFNRNSLFGLLEFAGLEAAECRTVGGSSLLFFSTLAKMINRRASAMPLGKKAKNILSIISSAIKYWYIAGDDELIVLAKNK